VCVVVAACRRSNIDRLKMLINSLLMFLCVDELTEAVSQGHVNNVTSSSTEGEQISEPVVHAKKGDDEERECRRKMQCVHGTGVCVALSGIPFDQLKGVMIVHKACRWKALLLLWSVECNADRLEQSYCLALRILLKEQRRIMDEGGGQSRGRLFTKEGVM
jgi:hypothetical protein